MRGHGGRGVEEGPGVAVLVQDGPQVIADPSRPEVAGAGAGDPLEADGGAVRRLAKSGDEVEDARLVGVGEASEAVEEGVGDDEGSHFGAPSAARICVRGVSGRIANGGMAAARSASSTAALFGS
jgi:hypothetical protein